MEDERPGPCRGETTGSWRGCGRTATSSSPPISSAANSTPSRSTSWGSDGASTTTWPSSCSWPLVHVADGDSIAPVTIAPGRPPTRRPYCTTGRVIDEQLVGCGHTLAIGLGVRRSASLGSRPASLRHQVITIRLQEAASAAAATSTQEARPRASGRPPRRRRRAKATPQPSPNMPAVSSACSRSLAAGERVVGQPAGRPQTDHGEEARARSAGRSAPVVPSPDSTDRVLAAAPDARRRPRAGPAG